MKAFDKSRAGAYLNIWQLTTNTCHCRFWFPRLLTYSDMEYNNDMARQPTTADVFNAIAEPQRRAILNLLRDGESCRSRHRRRPRSQAAANVKHLRVLSEVGVVSVRKDGRQRFYRLHGAALKPIFDWVMPFERLWQERFDRLDDYLKSLQREELTDDQQTTDDGNPR